MFISLCEKGNVENLSIYTRCCKLVKYISMGMSELLSLFIVSGAYVFLIVISLVIYIFKNNKRDGKLRTFLVDTQCHFPMYLIIDGGVCYWLCKESFA